MTDLMSDDQCVPEGTILIRCVTHGPYLQRQEARIAELEEKLMLRAERDLEAHALKLTHEKGLLAQRVSELEADNRHLRALNALKHPEDTLARIAELEAELQRWQQAEEAGWRRVDELEALLLVLHGNAVDDPDWLALIEKALPNITGE